MSARGTSRAYAMARFLDPEVFDFTKDPKVVYVFGAWRERVAALLREVRAQAGKTQWEIAVAIGVTRRTVNRIERGATEPSGLQVEQWLSECSRTAHIVLETK